MMIDMAWVEWIEKAFWSGVTGFGFAVLFNVSKRFLLSVFISSFFVGLVKFVSLHYGINIINASLLASAVAGFISIPFSRLKRTSPFIISIPSIISMIPGYFAYKSLLSIIRIVMIDSHIHDINLIAGFMHNLLNMLFILGAIAIGVALPWLLFKEKGLQKIKMESSEPFL